MTDERRPRNRKFRMLIGALAVVAIVSGGAAYAATKDDSPQARSQAIVDDAAGTLGVAPAALSDALKKAMEKQVDAQVTAGTLTQAQADAIKKRIEDGTQPLFGGPGGEHFGMHFGHRGFGGPGFGGPGFGGPGFGGPGFGGPGFGGPGFRGPGFGGPGFRGPGFGAGLDDLATYLGLKPAELLSQLRSGKSLADVAKAQGKTVADLESEITTLATKRLDAAVTAGKLTKDQEKNLLDGLAKHLDDFVNGVHEEHGFGHHGWKWGPGAPPAPADPPSTAPAAWAPGTA